MRGRNTSGWMCEAPPPTALPQGGGRREEGGGPPWSTVERVRMNADYAHGGRAGCDGGRRRLTTAKAAARLSVGKPTFAPVALATVGLAEPRVYSW